VRIWDAITGASISEPLCGHSSEVRSVAFAPDGTRIASGGSDGVVQVWNVIIRILRGSNRSSRVRH